MFVCLAGYSYNAGYEIFRRVIGNSRSAKQLINFILQSFYYYFVLVVFIISILLAISEMYMYECVMCVRGFSLSDGLQRIRNLRTTLF